MMHALAKAGFQQSYTYFAWRNAAWELEEYGRELSGDAAAYMRPSFWPTTHDILTPYMQYGGPTAWKLRAALAATMVPTYGIYAGYELMEHVARPGAEEQLDNEKYEYKDRQWYLYEPGGPLESRSPGVVPQAAQRDPRLAPGAALAAQPPLPPRRRRQLPRLLQDEGRGRAPRHGSRRREPRPHATRETWVHLDMEALGLATWSTFDAHDHVTEPDLDLATGQLRATRPRLGARAHHQREEPLNPCRDSTSPSPA